MPSGSASRKVLNIAEMREAFLRAVTPETRLTLHSVSYLWRGVAAYVFGADAKTAHYYDAHPCPPVEFGDPVDPALSWNQLSE
jgi:hypothetical protein